jgi:hypothetical protein
MFGAPAVFHTRGAYCNHRELRDTKKKFITLSRFCES